MSTQETALRIQVAQGKVRAIMGDAFAASYALYGFSEAAGRIYGVLYFAKEPVSLDDLVGQIGISKTTASVNMRFLTGLGLARRVWQPGRKEYYTAERDFSEAMLAYFRTTFQKECALVRGAIAAAESILEGAAGPAGKPGQEALDYEASLLKRLDKSYRGWETSLRVLGRLSPKNRKPGSAKPAEDDRRTNSRDSGDITQG